jgi:hypothetical protein
MKMKKISLLLIILFCFLAFQVPLSLAQECNECIGFGTPGTGDPDDPGCLTGLQKDFFTTGRMSTTNWDLAIWEIVLPSGEVVRQSSQYNWINGQAVDFSVSYDPSDGLITYTVGNATLTWYYDAGKAFSYVIPFGKGNANGNNTELTELSLQTTATRSICDIITENDYRGVELALTDSEQINGFTISGKVKLIWNTGGHPDEIPAFHIFVMNTHDPTAITLSSFNAIAGRGQVTLKWETATEIDNVGYNIYRAEAAEGNYIILNSEMIQADGSSIEGAQYQFIDTDVQNRKTYYYKLEDIDLNSNSTMHGPVSTTPRLIYGIFGK